MKYRRRVMFQSVRRVKYSTPLALEFSAQCTLQKDQDFKDLPITLHVIV